MGAPARRAARMASSARPLERCTTCIGARVSSHNEAAICVAATSAMMGRLSAYEASVVFPACVSRRTAAAKSAPSSQCTTVTTPASRAASSNWMKAGMLDPKSGATMNTLMLGCPRAASSARKGMNSGRGVPTML